MSKNREPASLAKMVGLDGKHVALADPPQNLIGSAQSIIAKNTFME